MDGEDKILMYSPHTEYENVYSLIQSARQSGTRHNHRQVWLYSWYKQSTRKLYMWALHKYIYMNERSNFEQADMSVCLKQQSPAAAQSVTEVV